MSALHAGDALWGLLIHVAKHVSGNPPHLDFLCAFGDSVAAVVTIDVFKRFVAAVANATVYLHGTIGRFATQTVGPVVTH